MPFQSEKQRRYMHANLPEIANRWEKKYGLGGIAELNSQLNSLPEYYLPKNQGGRIGYEDGTISPALKKRMLELLMQGMSPDKVKEEAEKQLRQDPYIKERMNIPGSPVVKEAAHGGLIPSHEAGIYGLADGGQLVQPGPGRPGYNGQGDFTPDRSTPSSDRGPRDDPDRFGPTVSTTAASEDIGAVDTIADLTSTRDDGPQRNVHFDTPEILEEQRKLDLQQMVRDQSEKTETWEKAQQWNKPKKGFWGTVGNIVTAVIPGLLPAKLATAWRFGQGVLNYKQGNYDKYLPDKLKSTGELADHITTVITETLKKGKQIRLNKIL